MEGVNGGAISPGTQAWCDGIKALMESGYDFGSVDSVHIVAGNYFEYCV